MALQQSLPLALYLDALRGRLQELFGIGIFPDDFLDDLGEKLGVVSFAAGHDETADVWSVAATLEIDAELAIQLPGLDQIKLIVGARPEALSTNLILNLSVRYAGHLYVSLQDIDVILQIDGMGAVQLLGEDAQGLYGDGATRLAPREAPIRIFSGGGCTLGFSTDGQIVFAAPEDWSMDPFCIPAVGLGLRAGGVRLRLTGATPLPPALAAAGLPADWVGIAVERVAFFTAEDSVLRHGLQELALEHFSVGRGGVSGRITGVWAPGLAADGRAFTGPGSGALLGIPFALRSAAVELNQNAFVQAAVGSALILPYFDAPLGVEIHFAADGSFGAGLSAWQPAGAPPAVAGLVTLSKPGLLELTVDSISFALRDRVFEVALGGDITPLVGDFDWPTFRVRDLAIDSEGKVRVEGGWLDLPEQYVLSLGGFQLEIARIGFGTQEADRRWMGFSGNLKLVDGITAGASVEGLRIAWDRGGQDISLTLSGVGVELDIPGSLYFKGYVSMTEPAPGVTRFDGQIALNLRAVGLEVEAQLAMGYDTVEDYAFFAIYIGVDLPAGIPLGSTGLGLYGLAGLLALQMEPNRRPNPAQPELPWYGIQPGPSWYHAPPTVGVADLRKWTNREGSLALGAGITLGTLADNGYAFAGKFLLGIVFPGPILFLEGCANILKERASLADEPMLRALAVLDARAGSFLVGVDAQYAYDEAGALIEIGGGAEVFFDFRDASAWHLYLGIDEPRERRIRAEIFSRLFEANAYFMLDAERLRTGAWIGYDADWEFGPLEVILQAWIEGRAELSFKPIYFGGRLWLHGKVEVSVFGFGFGLGADARIGAEVFDPFHILAELSVTVSLPWPLPDFEVGLELEWGPEPDPPLLPVPLKEISVEHLKVTTTWPLPAAGGTVLLLPDPDGDGDGFFPGIAPAAPADTQIGPSDLSPVVPLDARPRVTFGRPVHDSALVGLNPSPVFPDAAPESGWEWIGDPARNQGPARVRISVAELALERWSGSRWVPVARKAASANPAGVADLYGSWAPVPQLPAGTAAAGAPVPTANVKLWLWSKSAFDFARRTGGQWDQWVGRAFPDYPCIDLPPDREECCDFSELNAGEVPVAPWHCKAHPEIGISWRVPPAPEVRVVDGIPSLCFQAGAEVLVLVGTRAKRLRVSVHYSAAKERATCTDWREIPLGEGENPRQQGELRLLVEDKTGQPAAVTRMVEYATTAGNRRGLDAGLRTLVDLPPSDFVEIELTYLKQAPLLAVFGPGGERIAEALAKGPAKTPETIRLERGRGQREIVRLTVTAPRAQVAIHRICRGTRAAGAVGHAVDRHGRPLGSYPDVDGLIDVPGRDLVALRIEADGRAFCVQRLCLVTGIDQAERIQREEMLRHIEDGLVRWEADDEVLAPWTRYRLKIVSTLEVRDFLHDAGFNRTRTLTQCAYFRTQGPPGLASYSVPLGHPQENAAAPVGSGDPPLFDSGLGDLSRYVAQTVPPTVPAPGEKPPLPRPVYRAYDVGVLFNENYVETMYRLAGRDLALMLFDNNDRPVRDRRGLLVVAANRWGRADTAELSASEERWISHLNAASCVQIDRTRIARDLTLGTDGHVLDPQTVYEARLLPLLMHETFADYPLGTQARGTGSRLVPAVGAGWTVNDEGSDQGPSHWLVREAGNPPARYLEQASNVSAGAGLRGSAFPGGTFLVRADDARLGAGHPDQPGRWTDYRLSVYLRSADDDLIGIAVRWSGRSGYLFALDRELNRRRLIRLVGGVGTVLAESPGGYDLNRDYLASLEVVGERIRAFLDGVPVFDLLDSRHASGGVALYCGQNAGGQFRDPRVDDLRASAPVVYRFKFATSDFTDFRHHIHSFQGQLFRAVIADLDGIPAATAVAVALTTAQPPSETEARAYDALAAKALGTAARQPVARLDAVRVEYAGGALGLLLRTAEPIDWTRTAVALSRAPAQPLRPDPPKGPRLVQATFATGAAPRPNDESVTVLLDEGVDLGGWRIQRRGLPSNGAPALADGTVLFQADLNADRGPDVTGSALLWRPALASLTGIQVASAPAGIGTPMWAAGAGVLRQDGDFRTTDPAFLNPPPRLGTYAVRSGARWGDMRFSARLRASAGGAVGVVLRYRDVQNHYRFAFDSARNLQELSKRVNGTTSRLFSRPFTFVAGRYYRVVAELLAGRLRVSVDGVRVCEIFDRDLPRGSAGFYTYLRPLPRFDQVSAEALTRTLGPWTIVDHGNIRALSSWRVAGRALRQEVDLVPPALAAAAAPASGSAAVTGDPAWTDVRILAEARPRAAGIAGLVFRWRDPDHHYRLLLNGATGQRRLIRRSGGVSTVLWSGVGPFSAMTIAIAAIRDRLRAWVDDVPLFDLYDDALGAGQAGVLALDGNAAVWSAFEVCHAEPGWEDLHLFDATAGWRAAGRRLQILAGRSVDPASPPGGAGEERLFQETNSAAFRARLRAPGVDLRLVDADGRTGHLRRFLPDSAYAPETGARMLRSADGAGLFVLGSASGPAGAALAAGEYRLRLVCRRDNSALDADSLVLAQEGETSDETVELDVPWATY